MVKRLLFGLLLWLSANLAAAALTDDEGRVWARAEHVWIELERP